MNASVVKSETNSRCTSFTDSETNMQMYVLITAGFQTGPCFIAIGPAQSTPTLSNMRPG